MEKNKGLFSFRKHPVGDFLDEKREENEKGAGCVKAWAS